MNWFYAINGTQTGPVDQLEFDRLVQTGTITSDTLIWREGMPNWRAHGELVAATAPGAIALDQPLAVCSECGGAFALADTIRIGNRHLCASCKPVAMQKLSEGIVDTDDERVRREHIKHEASVKSIAYLYFLSSLMLLLVGLVAVAVRNRSTAGPGMAMGLFFLFFAGALIWMGIGLLRLKSWVRIPMGILSGLGLLGFPVGTIINAYILYLIFGKKGAMIFSSDYKRIIAATPHVKYKTSVVAWIALVVFVLLIITVVLLAASR